MRISDCSSYVCSSDLLTGDAATIAALPIALLLAYGGARVLAVVFAELREALFAKVAQRAIRNAALTTFRHLHALRLRYHLDRRTGGLSRVIERGVKGDRKSTRLNSRPYCAARMTSSD